MIDILRSLGRTVRRPVTTTRELTAFIRRGVKAWLRRRRRARLGKKSILNRKAMAFLLMLALLLGAFAGAWAFLSPDPAGRAITMDELIALAGERRIVEATFRDEDAHLVGRFTTPQPGPAAGGMVSGTVGGAGEFWVPYPKSDSMTATMLGMLTQTGAQVSVDPQTSKAQVRVAATFLPLMILATLFGLLFTVGKSGGGAIGEVTTLGTMGKGTLRSGRLRRGRLRRGQVAPVTFADVAGADEAVAELKEVRDYLVDPERYEQIGAQPPKGVLLVGSPGVGKTLIAKAVAGEVGVPFFSVAGAEFVESLVGGGAARIRDLFARVRAAAPAVVFIDELDAAGRKRTAGGGAGGSDEREQALNQLLVEMDGFEATAGIVVMAATNRLDILDPALMRPGRFDRHVTIERPDLIGRTQILELHARNKPVSPELDFGLVARRTPGFSGADLANVVNEAALLAVRQDKPEIDVPDVEEAIQRVLTGAGRKARMLTPQERKRVAYHESGHVIVSAATGRFDDVHRVSILAQGRSTASTTGSHGGDASILTQGQLQSKLVALLGGVSAEQLKFHEPSTGGEQDLAQATDLARDMIARYGMSPQLGKVRLLTRDADEFLDADIPFATISGQTQHDVDVEVRRLLEEAEAEATRILTQHGETLERLAARLEAEETLEGPDLEAVLSGVRPEVELFGGLVSAGDRPAPSSTSPSSTSPSSTSPSSTGPSSTGAAGSEG